MPFQDILRRTKRMSAEEASELWECAFLTREELSELLAYVSALPGIPSLIRCSSSAAIPGHGDPKWPAPISAIWIFAVAS